MQMDLKAVKASENVMTLKRGAGKIHDTFAMSICEDL